MSRWIYYVLLISYSLLFRKVCSIEIPCDQPYFTENNLMCYPCSAGYVWISDCVQNGTQARCQPCQRGEYMPSCDNSTQCAICGLACYPRQVIVKHCSATNDIECQCKDGYYWQPIGKYCKTHRKCGIGEGLASNGTPFEDTICVPCVTGDSYSENESFNACSPCSECNTTSTVITECSATHDVVCGILTQQPATQKLDERNLAPIVAPVAAIVIVAVVVIACILFRKWRRARDTNNTQSNTVELPSLNEVNCNSGPQNNSEDNKSFNVVDEKDMFNQNKGNSESDSCSENESKTESTATDCTETGNITVKSKVCHQNNEDNGLQTDRTANETNANVDDVDYNEQRESHVKKEDLKEETNIEHAQNDKSKDIPKSDDKSTLTTPSENDKLCIYATEQELASSGDLDSSNVSLDVVDVSPRGSVQSQDLSGNSEETFLTDKITPEVQTEIIEINGKSQEDRSDKSFQSDCTVWFETIAFLSQNLTWQEFTGFVRRLVVDTHEALIQTIDVEIDHAKEENSTCQSMIYQVMTKWRRATPKASVDDLVKALEESKLSLVSEHLAESLSLKGFGERILIPSSSGQNNKVHMIQSNDADHKIENLKEHEVEEFVA